MWFSIIKSKLLVKPKTQLRVQDNKEIDVHEPCKKKLKEYRDYIASQREYWVHKDTEVQPIFNKYDLKTTFDVVPRRKDNEKFKTFITIFFVSSYLDSEKFPKMPEKVACRMLDLIDNKEVREETIDGYTLRIYFRENKPTNFAYLDDLLFEKELEFSIEIIESDRPTIYYLTGGATINIGVKDKTIDFEKDMSARNFYNDILDFTTNKLDPKNWR